MPLQQPDWFATELRVFADAVRFAASGNLVDALVSLSSMREFDMRMWFIEHGANVHRFRRKIIGLPVPTVDPRVRDLRRSPSIHERSVFERDGFRCRYCETWVLPRKAMKAFGGLVGENAFMMGRRDLERHGGLLSFSATADHVTPWQAGGSTTPDNLVTSCWNCNFGKGSATLEELGLDDPRNRDPLPDPWDGLVGQLLGLQARRT